MWQGYIVRRIVKLNRERRYAEAVQRLDRDLPLFSRYAQHAASGSTLVAELMKLRAAASREWDEGNRKEVEVAMHKRMTTRADARSGPRQAWSSFVPGEEREE